MIIGIRREDKSVWERRVPLIPRDMARLKRKLGFEFLVESSPVRVFEDEAYAEAGGQVTDDISGADIIVGVKEVPSVKLRPGKVYLYFSHVIKGQPYNMTMLRRLLEQKCTLIDYERITDDDGRRLVFFGRHAGLAGMIDTLWCLGAQQEARGIDTPLAETLHAWEYDDSEAAMEHIRGLGQRYQRRPATPSLVFGVTGEGNVSRGTQEILDALGAVRLEPEELLESGPGPVPRMVQVVFGERHMVERKEPDAPFDLQEYYGHPERYRSRFETWLPHLDVLVNAIYWEERYPRLVTREWARRTWTEAAEHDEKPWPRLRVIGDISCDIGGAIELTVESTTPAAPFYLYDPIRERISAEATGDGIAIMAVDNLPCELPAESSRTFSKALSELLPPLAATDWSRGLSELGLPGHLERAVITHQGELTPSYRYLARFLGNE